MSSFEWLAELRAVLPEDAITVLDGNIVMTAAPRMLLVRRPASRLTPGTNGCMGIGIPFAVGAKLARPEIPVVAIVGDFAFGLSAIELETAVRHHVPVVVVVANNAGAGGATRQRSFFAADHPERVLQFGTAIPARPDNGLVRRARRARRAAWRDRACSRPCDCVRRAGVHRRDDQRRDCPFGSGMKQQQ